MYVLQLPPNVVQEKVDKFPQDMLVAAENTHGMDGEKEKAIVEHLERLSRDGFEKLMMENKLEDTLA